MLSPSKCPKCGAVYYGIPHCQECGWIDPDWEVYEKEMEEFWEKHKDDIIEYTQPRQKGS